MKNSLFLGVLSAALLAGCATAPKPLEGTFASELPADSARPGDRVRWGGEIISVEPKPEATCIQVLSRELGATARPRLTDQSAGRFLACREGFYDPAVFTAGREITVTGSVGGTETRRIGEYDYPLPRVDADVIYLWPERPDYVEVYDPFFYPGFYGGFYRPFWPYHYRPYHYRAPRGHRPR